MTLTTLNEAGVRYVAIVLSSGEYEGPWIILDPCRDGYWLRNPMGRRECYMPGTTKAVQLITQAVFIAPNGDAVSVPIELVMPEQTPIKTLKRRTKVK